MKKFLMLTSTLTLICSFANAKDYTLSLSYIKLKDVNFLSNQSSSKYLISKTSYSLNAPTNHTPSLIIVSAPGTENNTQVKDWVKDDLAKDGIDWAAGNMNADTASDSMPSKLSFAIKANLTLVTGIKTYNCENVYLGYGSDNWWVFSNNNNKDNTITCRAVGELEDSYISYGQTGKTSFNFIMQ